MINEIILSQDSPYDEWVSLNKASVVEALEEFPSVHVDAAALISTLPILQPRFYSISSSAAVVPTEIHMYASLVRYSTQNGRFRRGLCTSYLEEINLGDFVTCYFHPNPQFHLPTNPAKPLIWIASGSGIAPFRFGCFTLICYRVHNYNIYFLICRGFWQQRCNEKGVAVHNRFFPKITSLCGNNTKQNIQQSRLIICFQFTPKSAVNLQFS